MKLTAAKCPSCGADIEVDKDSDKTKCEFCGSSIIVEDAIAKIKISGSVEISNLPKTKTLLINANRAYDSGEYDEAYQKYDKLLELDPNQGIAVFRKSLIKNVLSSNSDSDPRRITDSYKIACELIDDKKALQDCLIDFYNKTKSMCDDINKNTHVDSTDEIKEIFNGLSHSLSAMTLMFDYIDNDDNKLIAIDSILIVADYLLAPRYTMEKVSLFSFAIATYGGYSFKKYDYDYIYEVKQIIEKYEDIKDKIINKDVKIEEPNKEEVDNKPLNIKLFIIIGAVFYVLMIIIIMIVGNNSVNEQIDNLGFIGCTYNSYDEEIYFKDKTTVVYKQYLSDDKTAYETAEYKYKIDLTNELVTFDKYTFKYFEDTNTLCTYVNEKCIETWR